MKRKNNLRKSINESVKQFIMEFGSGNSEKAKENRKKMAMASKRAIDKGDASVYNNSVRSITTGGGSKNDLGDFNDEFEKLNSQPANNLANEGRNQIKVSESQLKEIIKESVMRILEKFGNSQVGQYQMGRLAARKKEMGDEEGYKSIVNNAKLQWGADRGVGTNQNAFGNGFHVGKDNVKHGYDLAKKGKL